MYWLRDLTTNNMQNIENMFPMVTLEEDDPERWINFDELDGLEYVWMYLYPGLVSLVYIPSSYVTEFDGGRVWFHQDMNKTVIHSSTSAWGIKLVTGYGITVILDEGFYEKRFARPTLQELIRYQSMIACPARYEKPIHRFLRKVIRNWQKPAGKIIEYHPVDVIE